MKIGGFDPFTLSDYPGEIAAIVFTQGCNFRCPFCHNGSLIPADNLESNLIPQTKILSELKAKSKKLDALVISGGEPTLQPDLPDFIRSCKSMGFKIKLDTNGSRPDIIEKLIHDNLLDYIAMDIKAPLESYERLAGVKINTELIQQSITVIAQSGIPHQFRTTNVNSLLTQDDLDKIRTHIPQNSTYIIQDFKPDNVYNPVLCNL